MLECPNCQKKFQVPLPTPPPALPARPPAMTETPGLRVAGSRASETPPVQKAQTELEQGVLDGGRFVIFQYCFSVLVMSFKRPSVTVYLRPGEDGVGPAVGHSLISLLVGWWGIPWGPIWTIATVVKNARGGIDVTQDVLTERLGPGRAAQIMAQRRIVPTQGWGLKAFRWGLGGFALLLVLFLALPFIMIMASPGSRNGESAPTRAQSRELAAGEREFQSANSQIGVKRGGVAFGNTPQAIAVANQFSTGLKALRESMFEGGKPNGLSTSGHEFLTYCELQDSKCAIIVHVPELRRFDAQAKESLGLLAWDAAQAALRKQGAARPGMNLAVGLRGIALYDRVLVGKVVATTNRADNGLRNTSKESRPERELFGYFQPPTRPVPTSNK